MQVRRLDHFTIRTPRLEETLAFYQRVAGLATGFRPAFDFPGHWLYADGVAVVHLAVADNGDAALTRYLGSRNATPGSGSLDHLAFRCSGLEVFEQRLRSLDVAYDGRTVPELGEHQVFVRDPNEVRVEFIFDARERASWTQRAAPAGAAR